MIMSGIMTKGYLIFGFISWSMGVQLYDPMTQVCCQGQVHDMPQAEDDVTAPNIFCCGDAPYDLQSSICCHETILPRNHSNISCCGDAVYDVTASLCCSGAIVEIPEVTVDDFVTKNGDVPFENSTQTTFYHMSMLCCGQEAYDWRYDMCCADGVRQRPHSYAECCGTSDYDISQQVCCGDAVHAEDNPDVTLFCCGQQAYDSNVQHCCDRQLYDKPDTGADYQCCGGQLMNVATESCCDGAVVPAGGNVTSACCGKLAYDFEMQLCCDGELRDAAESLKCCGTATYSFDDSVCCNGAVLPSPANQGQNPTAVSCCGTALLTDALEMCCEGQVFRHRTKMTRCCGGTTYESDQQLCCGGSPVARSGATQQCCGGTVYDTDTQVCCYEGDFQVLDKNGSQVSCCSRSSDFNGHGIEAIPT